MASVKNGMSVVSGLTIATTEILPVHLWYQRQGNSEYLERLLVHGSDSPCICVAEWGEDAGTACLYGDVPNCLI